MQYYKHTVECYLNLNLPFFNEEVMLIMYDSTSFKRSAMASLLVLF